MRELWHLVHEKQKIESTRFIFHAQKSPRNVNRSTDKLISDDMAEKVETKMKSGISLDLLKSQIAQSLTVKTYYGSNLRVRNSNGKIVGRVKNGSTVEFLGKTKISRDKSGQVLDTDNDGSLENRHLWFYVKINNGKEGWISAEYLQGNLKEVVKTEPDAPVVAKPLPKAKHKQPKVKNPEVTVKPLNLDIKAILPEFAEYIEIDQTLPGWIRYTEGFHKVPLQKQRVIQTAVMKALQGKMQTAFQGGIDKKIQTASLSGNIQLSSYFKALKSLSPLGGGSLSLSKSRALLKAGGPQGAEVLSLMNHDAERVRNGQMLALFESIESSKHEAIMDNWAITNYFSEKDEGSQDRINLIHKVSPIVQEVFKIQGADIKTIEVAIDKLINDPSIRPNNISVEDLQIFKKYWNSFQSGEGQDLNAIDVNDDDFMEKLASKSQSKWLDIAKKMEEEGQHDQAQQIVEQMVFGLKFADGQSVDQKLESLVGNSKLREIKSEVEKELKKKMDRGQVLKMYEEQGFFTDKGLEGFGLVKQPNGNFLDPINNVEVSRSKAMDLIVDNAIKITREKLTKQKTLFEISDNDILQSKLGSRLGFVEQEALTLYKEISGAGDTGEWDIINLSSKNEDFWTEELVINISLIAASAAGVGLLGLGARAVAGVSSLARATRLTSVAGRMGKVGLQAGKYGRLAGMPVRGIGKLGQNSLTQSAARLGLTGLVDGIVFHNINATLSTPIVGKAAWDNYGTGIAHSVGMYLAFGVGNAVWAKGLNKVAGGSKFTRLSTQTLREAMRNGRGIGGKSWELAKTIAANEPKLALEAAAFTHMTTDAEFGSEEYWTEFSKQLVTMNLLWGMPKVGGKSFTKEKTQKKKTKQKQLLLEDLRPKKITKNDKTSVNKFIRKWTQKRRKILQKRDQLIDERGNTEKGENHDTLTQKISARNKEIAKIDKALKQKRTQLNQPNETVVRVDRAPTVTGKAHTRTKASASKHPDALKRLDEFQGLMKRQSRLKRLRRKLQSQNKLENNPQTKQEIQERINKLNEKIEAVEIETNTFIKNLSITEKVKFKTKEVASKTAEVTATSSKSFYEKVATFLKRAKESRMEQKNETIVKKSNTTRQIWSKIKELNIFSKARRENISSNREINKTNKEYEKALKKYAKHQRIYRKNKNEPNQINKNSKSNKALEGMKQAKKDVIEAQKRLISAIDAKNGTGVEVIQNRILEIQTLVEKSSGKKRRVLLRERVALRQILKDQGVQEKVKTVPKNTKKKDTNKTDQREQRTTTQVSINSKTSVTKQYQENSEIILMDKGKRVGIKIDTASNKKSATTIELTQSYFDSSLRKTTLGEIKIGETKTVKMLNEKVIIKRTEKSFEIKIEPNKSYTVENVDFTFEPGVKYQSGKEISTFLRQENEAVIFKDNTGKEVSYSKQQIDKLVTEQKVSRVDE